MTIARIKEPRTGLAEIPYNPAAPHRVDWHMGRMGDGIPVDAPHWEVNAATEWQVTDHVGRVYDGGWCRIDHTSHHYRATLGLKDGRPVVLYVQQFHGGGHSAWTLGGNWPAVFAAIGDELARYHFCDAAIKDAEDIASTARDTVKREWSTAFVEGRIRKSRPKRGFVTVSIESKDDAAARLAKVRGEDAAAVSNDGGFA